MREVSYSGAAPAYQDSIAGRVDMMVDFLKMVAAPRATTGQLKRLAITARKRSPKIPDAATWRRPGSLVFRSADGLVSWRPRALRVKVVMTMNTEVNRLLREPDVQEDGAYSTCVAIMAAARRDLRCLSTNELKKSGPASSTSSI